jgi:PAS domain S-box-containing protein
VLENSLDASYKRNLQTNAYDYLSPVFARISGYTQDEMKSLPIKTVIDLIHPDDQAEIESVITESKSGATGAACQVEYRFKHKEGHHRWFHDRFTIMRDAEGQPVALIGSMSDITDRKQAEAALQESKLKAEQYLNVSAEIIISLDRQGNITLLNDNGHKLLGYDPGELIGKNWFKTCLQEDAVSEVSEVFNKLMNAELENVKHFENMVKTKKGLLRCVFWHNTLLRDAEYTVIGLLSSGEDITERKQAEEALRKSEAQMRAITDSTQDAILMMDQNGSISFWNPAAESIFGYTGDEAIGKNLHQLIAPQHYHEAHNAAFIRFQQTGQGNVIDSTLELKACHKNGHEISVELSLSSLHLQDRWHSVGIIRDISERKRAEQEKAKLEGQLQRAQKMESIGSLAGGIAHDLNNILFPISGLSEMLLDDMPADNPAFENIEQIYKSAQRGSDLVKQILAFSRQGNPQKLPVRIQPILKEALKLAQATIPRNIEITSHINTDCGMVSADPTQIHQIVMNLITNAFHAVEQTGGMIDITLKEIVISSFGEKEEMTYHAIPGDLLAGNYACITVSDTGTGIDKTLIDKIFDPYFTTKKQGKGTGLGLSVVHGIVKEHGGDIRVYSEVGKGTTFNVYLPLLEDTRESKSAGMIRKYPTGHERILLIDDEEPIVLLEQMMLEKLGYQVTVCTSSPDALAAFKANPSEYDLIISDKGMPNMTGEQLARELISIKPRIPIIICSGFSDENDEQQAKSIGVKGFLKKPVATGDLAEMVRKVLDDVADNALTTSSKENT